MEPNGDKPEAEGVHTGPETTSEAEPSNFGVSFASSRTSGAPPETSGATAVPVKPYTPVSAAQSSAIKMSSVNNLQGTFNISIGYDRSRMNNFFHTYDAYSNA